MKTLKLMLSTTILASMVMASTAHADGWLAEHVIGPVLGQQVADAADQWNAQGHYVENAAASAIDYFVPGLGQTALTVYEMQQAGAFNGNNQGHQAYNYQGPNYSVRPAPVPQVRMSNVCTTPATGPVSLINYSGPVGSPCYVNTPYGQAYGNIQ